MVPEQTILDICIELGIPPGDSSMIRDAIAEQSAKFPTTFEPTLTALFTKFKAQRDQQESLAISRQNTLKKAGSLEWDTTGSLQISMIDVVEDTRQKLITLLDISDYFEGESNSPYGYFKLSRG